MPSVNHWVLQILTTLIHYYAHKMQQEAKFTADREFFYFCSVTEIAKGPLNKSSLICIRSCLITTLKEEEREADH
jgi:hypothetical protein